MEKDSHTIPEPDTSFLIELGKPLSKAKTIKETLDTLMYQVGRIFQPENWSLLLKDPKTGDMTFTIVVGNKKEELEGKKLAKGEGIAGRIVSTGESVIIADVGSEEDFSKRMDTTTGFTTQSIIGVPLKTDDRIFGVIELINKISGQTFTQLDLQMLSAIAEYAAIAIERSYYNQALKRIAVTDPVTGVKNRSGFEQMLQKSDRQNKRYGTKAAVVLVFLDNFRSLMEAGGRAAGDRAAKRLASVLKESAGKADSIFRYREDEFIVLMPHTGKERAEAAGKELAARIGKLQPAGGTPALKTSIKIHAIEDGNIQALLKTAESGPGPEAGNNGGGIENMEKNLQPIFNEEKSLADQESGDRQAFVKNTSLSGEFVRLNGRGKGDLQIRKISMQGVQFKIFGRIRLIPEEIVDITFTLDNAKRSVIKRRVRLRSVNGNLANAVFYNPPPYDKALGMYLMWE
ncbi:MAG: diguanylate cyclase [Desulfarculaceae bacterium]|nr:diguanylate cyclase [Desulfarculaceae bacterium]